jgi:hypothetical protein
MKYFGILAAVISLSACGGTSLGIAEVGSGPVKASELLAFQDSYEQFNTSPPSPVTSAALRSSGNATYDGVLVLGVTSADDGFIGRMQLNVGFSGTGSVSGTANDFVVVDGNVNSNTISDSDLMPTTGALTFSNGTIDRSGTNALLSFDMDGTIAVPTSISGLPQTRTATVDGEMAGGFADNFLVSVGGANFTGDGIDLSAFGVSILEE